MGFNELLEHLSPEQLEEFKEGLHRVRQDHASIQMIDEVRRRQSSRDTQNRYDLRDER